MVTSFGLGGCLVVNGAFQAAEGEGEGSGTSSTTTTVVTGGPEVTSSGSSSSSASEGSDGASASSSGASSSGPGVDESTSTADATTGSSSTGPDLCAGSEGDLCTSQAIGDQTYLICEKQQTWEAARLTCEARCARLAILGEPESATLLAALRAQMTDADKQEELNGGGDQYTIPRASWWIGGHKVDGAYQWLDGAPMPPMATGGWHPSDPNIAGPDACVVLGVFSLADKNGTWLDRSCVDVPYRAICEPL